MGRVVNLVWVPAWQGGLQMTQEKTEKAAKCYMPPQTLIYKLVLNLCCTADSSYESAQMYS